MNRIYPPFVRRYKFYLVSGFIFFIWITFFDRANLISQIGMIADLKKFKSEEEILGNIKSLEKFAREKYLMKKEGETVFVLVDKSDKKIEEKE